MRGEHSLWEYTACVIVRVYITVGWFASGLKGAPHRSLVGEHGQGLELGDGLGDVGVLLLGGSRTLAPQVAGIGPAHPAAGMRLELACAEHSKGGSVAGNR